MERNQVELQSVVRGVRWVAYTPDVRYRTFHEVYVHPSETRVGACYRVTTPARYSEHTGRLLCAAGTSWRTDHEDHVDNDLRRMRYSRDLAGKKGPKLLSTGDMVRMLHADDPGGEWGIVTCLLSNGEPRVILVSEDPDVAAIVTELAQLDAAWTESHRGALARESRTQECVARAVASEGIRVPPTETECLECGAVYDRPGQVETGSMGCRRCS